MKPFTKNINSENIPRIMMCFTDTMPLERAFAEDRRKRYQLSVDELIEFVYIFQYRPDMALRLADVLKEPGINFIFSSEIFESAAERAAFTNEFW